MKKELKKEPKKELKKTIGSAIKKVTASALLALALFGAFGEAAWASQTKMTRQQYKKKLAYNKNALPAGWQYEGGYTLWRMQKGLAANPNTYKKYKRDKGWRNKMHRNHRTEEIVLDTLDWTAEEVALFWQNYQDFFKFHPAGVE
ncbi:MAG: hypothetical protein LBP21_02195 [Synergistaceae bacterium]|jgi:hypothetical protein|nr:hypothetical protein [Synergistaceae bacterium]